MIRVEIHSVRVSLMSQHRVIVLREQDGTRYLPIWIGPCEADSITMELQGVPVARPLTHDLIKSILAELSVQVPYIVVTDLHDDTFYAHIILDVNGERKEIDARPSDAIALAVRLDVPIYVAEEVLDRAGIIPESESEGAGSEDEEDLSVFKDFLDSLDLGSGGSGS
jgi:bifunctional DNase/RNase